MREEYTRKYHICSMDIVVFVLVFFCVVNEAYVKTILRIEALSSLAVYQMCICICVLFFAIKLDVCKFKQQ